MLGSVVTIAPLLGPFLMATELRSRDSSLDNKLCFYSKISQGAIGAAFTAYHISFAGGASLAVASLWSALSVRENGQERIPDVLVGLLPKLANSLAVAAWAETILGNVPYHLAGWGFGLTNFGLGVSVAAYALKNGACQC